MAGGLCDNAPLAVRESLALARAAAELTEEDGWRRSAEAAARVHRSDDAREGPRAFAEKRRPQWRGR